ncbi:hypothetical protein CHARACLAT_033542 [Characodon lateralis]|uniref:Uncharacterized protein n=1 Tax=Characodon lateralis TaxID=208331 RepID=A0ABU7EQ38_9TELE|nr:hypothetical protein [Characodon lateralis]
MCSFSFSSFATKLISTHFILILCNSTSFVQLPEKAAFVYEHAAASSAFRFFYKPLMHVQCFQRGLTYIQTQEPVSESKSERGREWEQLLSSNHKEAHIFKLGGHKGNSSIQLAYEIGSNYPESALSSARKLSFIFFILHYILHTGVGQ